MSPPERERERDEATPTTTGAVPSPSRPRQASRRRLSEAARPLRALGQGLRALGWGALSALRRSLVPFQVLARYDAPLVEGDAERVLERAVRIATRQGSARVEADHLWAALLEEEPVRRALSLVGAPAREVSRLLTPVEETNEPRSDRPAVLGGVVKDLVGHAVSHAFRAERAHVLAGDLLVALLEDELGAPFRWLEERGVKKADLVAAVAHGRAALEEPSVPDGTPEAEVLLYDDEYTSRSLVFDALRVAFGMARGEAQRSLVKLDARGTVSLGVLPTAEALAKARAVNEYARSRGAPLLARAVPASEGDADQPW